MAETTEQVPEFEAYLAERNLTPDAYQGMPEEMRQYIWETWQWEHKVIAPQPAATDTEPEAEAPIPLAVVNSHPPVQQPVPPPTVSTNRSQLLTIVCAVLLIVLIAVLFRLRPTTKDLPPVRPDLNLSPSILQPGTQQPGGTGTVGSQTGWQMVARAEQQPSASVPFTITGTKWRISWNTRPGSKGPDDFSLSIKLPNGRILNQAAHLSGEGEGELVLRGSGRYTLEIASGQNYQVKVFDFR